MIVPSFRDIEAAHQRIIPFVRHTVVVESSAMNELLKAQLFFKCENLQKAGAFKFRGALNAILSLSDQQLVNGVATHSSGNHAAALSLAASLKGVKAYIVMPDTAPAVKVNAVKQYGGVITFCEPTLEARESTLAKVVAETGATFIHPYNNFNVICGQGTAAKELLEEVGPLDVVMAPVGGGGLMSGTSISAKALCPQAQIIGAEPKNADDACRSLNSGQLVLSDNPETMADGLRTSLSDLTWEIIRTHVNEIFTASESSIKASMVLLKKQAAILAEPSSAVPLAALLENRSYFEGKRVGMIISGGNYDAGLLED